MFKLVIVEDEDNIRHSLECFIPWKELGFQVVNTFSDGSDALAYLQDNPCDALLTDILMSRMSGLELIRNLREIHPQTKVVILSGHSEFTFAQQAITYQVSHYLVKPVDEDELMSVFKGIAEQLAHEQVVLPDNPRTADADLPEQQADEALYEDVVSAYKLLIIELDLGNKHMLVHMLDSFLGKLHGTGLSQMQSVLKNLYAVIEQNYLKRKISALDITNGKFDAEHLYNAKTENAVISCVKEDFCALCDGLKNRKPVSKHSVIEWLVQYLNAHIDEDIAHDVIAKKYRMHPGYLSRLFKQEIGETLSEYILRIKMEKAAQLLREGQYKVGEVAAMVGYSASSYFSIMFKKYTGYSPREYSRRISQ